MVFFFDERNSGHDVIGSIGCDAGREHCNDSSSAEQSLKQEQVEKKRCVKRTAAFVGSGARGLLSGIA
jgi:hypothetical protein